MENTTNPEATMNLKSGDKFYEGNHTEWTFIRKTNDGFLFRAHDGLEHTFDASDLSVLTSIKGSEVSAF